MRKTTILLALIFLIGMLLRFYHLGEIPIGFHRDEAFLGYNAYSILKTARDMNGQFLPLHLKSFLYSPAGYSYISVPFIMLFGLNEFSVRFASALFGSLTILITYFLSRELFSINSKSDPSVTLRASIPVIAAAMVAVSPWHINLSRTATENVIVVFFISLGLLLYLFWVKKDNIFFLIASYLSFAITLLIYQAPRAFLPLLIPIMIFAFIASKMGKGRIILSVTLFVLLIILPLFVTLFSKDLSLRIRTVSVFSTGGTQLILDQQIREDGTQGTSSPITRVFHNKFEGYLAQFLDNYFKHFSYDFLFTDQGFPDRYRVPLAGLLYVFELPFLIFGTWKLIEKESKVGLFLVAWVLLVPVGSALTFDDIPNLQRTLIFFPALSIIVAYGLLSIFILICNKEIFSKIILFAAVPIVSYGIFFYLHQYYVHENLYRPWYRHDGYKALVAKVNGLLPLYKKAVVTDRESAPTIFFLFYTKFDPSLFQKETKNSTFHDFDRIGFAKYEFTQEECPVRAMRKGSIIVTAGEKGILYVNSGLCKVPDNVEVLYTIKRADSSIVFRVIDFNTINTIEANR